MRIIEYTSGSTGRMWILNYTYEIKVRQFNPWVTKWNYESIKEQFGVRLSSFTKNPIELELVLKFRGSEQGISDRLNEFFADCEQDIGEMKAGRLSIETWYLNGFFIERQTEPARTFYGYEQTLRFLAPYPFWIKDYQKVFPKNSSIESTDLNYDYDYDYDFTPDIGGDVLWKITHTEQQFPSHFQMKIQGAAVNPRIAVNGHIYEVETTLGANELLVIDSRDNTITGIQQNGTRQNLYMYRNTSSDIFRKMPIGNKRVTWNGTFSFQIIAFVERSEPPWL